MQCPNCCLLNPPDAVRSDCGYNFSIGIMEHLLVDQRKTGRRRQFFRQYAISVVVGTLVFLALRSLFIHFDVRPPFGVAVALMPAVFFLIFSELNGGTAAMIVGSVAFLLNAL